MSNFDGYLIVVEKFYSKPQYPNISNVLPLINNNIYTKFIIYCLPIHRANVEIYCIGDFCCSWGKNQQVLFSLVVKV